MAPSATSDGIVRARQFVDAHYARPIMVARLARMAGLSTFHFIRAFRQATGSTPHQYLRERRIARARELLIQTPLPVTEICDAVGFQSLGSFSALFRRLTGESPAAFRAARRRNVYIPGCFGACIAPTEANGGERPPRHTVAGQTQQA